METNDSSKPANQNTKVLIGTVITGVGIALLLFNLDIIDSTYRQYVFSWHTLLIVAGLINLFSRDNWPTGLILLTVGIWLMTIRIYNIEIDFFKIIVPILLIMVGLIVLLKKKTPKLNHQKSETETENSDYNCCGRTKESGEKLNEINIFSGSNRIYTSALFEGGSIVNIFGGAELDLRQTELKEGTTILETVSIFGGLSLKVPENWEIKSETVAILGSFSDKRKTANLRKENSILIVRGINIFGSTEIKNDVWIK